MHPSVSKHLYSKFLPLGLPSKGKGHCPHLLQQELTSASSQRWDTTQQTDLVNKATPNIEVQSKLSWNKPFSAILSESKCILFRLLKQKQNVSGLAENLSYTKWPGLCPSCPSAHPYSLICREHDCLLSRNVCGCINLGSSLNLMWKCGAKLVLAVNTAVLLCQSHLQKAPTNLYDCL